MYRVSVMDLKENSWIQESAPPQNKLYLKGVKLQLAGKMFNI